MGRKANGMVALLAISFHLMACGSPTKPTVSPTPSTAATVDSSPTSSPSPQARVRRRQG